MDNYRIFTKYGLNEFFNNELECKVCEGHLPNKNMFTKNGCVWCDAEYWRMKNDRKK